MKKKKVDIGGPLPENVGPGINPDDEQLFREFLWSHIGLVRSHAKYIPLKPRRRLAPEKEADLKWNLEMIIYQARYALGYLKKRNDIEKHKELDEEIK